MSSSGRSRVTDAAEKLERAEAFLGDVQNILDHISYKPDTGFRCGLMGDGVFIQHYQMIPDCNDPKAGKTEQRGGKYYVSTYSCESEIVQKAFYACKQFEEHEVREWFEWAGYRLFGPHISMYALAEVCHRTDQRE